MKERPILFSAPMVRAILAGRKTVTRRMVKGIELARGEARGVRVAPNTFCYLDFDGVPGLSWRPFGGSPTVPYPPEKVEAACPYGGPGDRLWVRETWAPAGYSVLPTLYRADGDEQPTLDGRWRPSIHMPRWASRITLEVTDVRVERLQAITEADAVAEGVERDRGRDVPAAMGGGVETWLNYLDRDAWCTSARASYVTLWESINGAGSWSVDPWVWVVSFRKLA